MRNASRVAIGLTFCSITLVAVDVQDVPPPATGARPVPEVNTPSVVTISPEGRLQLLSRRPLLAAVLQEISATFKLPIVIADGLANERLSIQLSDVFVEDALRQLLARYDAFYLYTADEKSPGAIAAIWVYPRGQGRDLMPVPPELWAGTKELLKQLEDGDPQVRIQAYETLIEREGERGLEAVLRGLTDSIDAVRLVALSAAGENGIEIPASKLADLVFADPSDHVRLVALQQLENRPEAASVASLAQNDPSEHVRNQATQILRRLKPPQ